MSPGPRLLLVSAFAGQGGIGRWLALSLPELARRMNVRCLLKTGVADMQAQFRVSAPGVIFSEAPLQSVRDAFGLSAILREIRVHKPQVIMVHDVFSMVGIGILRLLGLLGRCRLLVVVHSTAADFPHVRPWKIALVNTLAALALRRNDVIVAVSALVESQLRQSVFRHKRIVIVLNGFRPAAVEPIARNPRDRLQAGFVGRFSIEKGADRIGGLIELLKDCPLQWHVAGAGLLEATVRRELQPHLECGRAHYYGWVADPVQLIRRLDVLVIVSRTEGCPFSVLEAHACGTLVVSLAVGGMPEILDNGAAGILVQDLGALAGVLRKLSREGLSGQSILLERAARILRERYSFDGMTQKYSSLIHELASS